MVYQGIGGIVGGSMGSLAAGLYASQSNKNLKKNLRLRHPNWSEDKINEEYQRLKKNTIGHAVAGGLAGGAIGGLAGHALHMRGKVRNLNGKVRAHEVRNDELGHRLKRSHDDIDRLTKDNKHLNELYKKKKNEYWDLEDKYNDMISNRNK